VWTTIAIGLVLNAMEPVVSTKQLARYLHTEFPTRNVYLYRNFEELSSLPFYLKKPLAIIDSRSNDLYWGNKLRSNDIVISTNQFEPRLQNQRLVVVVMERQLKDFKTNVFFPKFKAETKIGETTVFFN
jgi:hypothetical protein